MIPQPRPYGEPLDTKGLITVLVKHYGVHEGLFDLFLEYQMAFGTFGPSPELQVPGAVVGISKLGLTRVNVMGPLTVDAGVVNPEPAQQLATPTRSESVRRRSKS